MATVVVVVVVATVIGGVAFLIVVAMIVIASVVVAPAGGGVAMTLASVGGPDALLAIDVMAFDVVACSMTTAISRVGPCSGNPFTYGDYIVVSAAATAVVMVFVVMPSCYGFVMVVAVVVVIDDGTDDHPANDAAEDCPFLTAGLDSLSGGESE